MNSLTPQIKAALAHGASQLQPRQVSTCKEMAGSLWHRLTNKQKQDVGRDFFHTGEFERLGLIVVDRCEGGASQTYRLAGLA